MIVDDVYCHSDMYISVWLDNWVPRSDRVDTKLTIAAGNCIYELLLMQILGIDLAKVTASPH